MCNFAKSIVSDLIEDEVVSNDSDVEDDAEPEFQGADEDWIPPVTSLSSVVTSSSRHEPGNCLWSVYWVWDSTHFVSKRIPFYLYVSCPENDVFQ